MRIIFFVITLFSFLSAIDDTMQYDDNNKTNQDIACAQIITYAINPDTLECSFYSTPCDVPKGFERVVRCPQKTSD
jgi:hypothetical protein